MTPKLKERPLPMTQSKPYDDSNWRQEYLGYKHVNKKQRELLENGAKSLSQSWLLGAMYSEWKQMKGYNKYDPKENVGQLQSSMKDFFKDHG